MNAYKQHIQNKESTIVEVTVPSGFVFQFRKPGVFGTLFGIGGLPQTAASEAVEKWVEQGILEVGEGDGALSPDAVKNLNMGMAVVDRVIQLSHKPKLVSGVAQSEDELAVSDVDEADLAYLFKWVAQGGDLSAMLATFPQRSEPDALASASRPQQRHKTKQAGGHQ